MTFPMMSSKPFDVASLLTSMQGGAPPVMPSAPMPAAPVPSPVLPQGGAPMASPSSAPRGSGVNLGALLQHVMPGILAAIAAKQGGPGAAGAVLQGFAAAAAKRVEQQRAEAQAEIEASVSAEERAMKLADFRARQQKQFHDFINDAMQTIQDETDPARQTALAMKFDEVAKTIYGAEGALFSGLPQAGPDSTKRAKAAQEILDKLQKTHGERFAALADLGTTVPFEGQPTTIRDLQGIAGLALTDPATGQAPRFPTAAASDIPGTSDFSTYLRQVFAEAEQAKGSPLSATERRTLTLKARRDFGTSDDRPTDPALADIRNLNAQILRNQLLTGITPQQQTRAETLANSFRQEPIVKKVNVMAEAVSFVESLKDDSHSAADDQALIYAFAKAMDPDSVVREGEYATVQKYAQSWLQNFGFNAQRVIANTEFLSQDARAKMKATVRTKFSAGLRQYENLRQQVARQINRVTGRSDGAEFLVDYGAAFPTTPEAGATSTARGFSVVVGGRTYTFPTAEALAKFKADMGIK